MIFIKTEDYGKLFLLKKDTTILHETIKQAPKNEP